MRNDIETIVKNLSTLSKSQSKMLVFDSSTYGIKTKCKKTNETFASLRAKGYKTASEIAETEIPSHYLYSETEGRLFFCTMMGCTEVVSATVKSKGWAVFN